MVLKSTSFFNVAAGTVLDLANGDPAVKTLIVAHSSHGGDNQIWFLDRRNFDIADVSTSLNTVIPTRSMFIRFALNSLAGSQLNLIGTSFALKKLLSKYGKSTN
jgi:hypothetical protein